MPQKITTRYPGRCVSCGGFIDEGNRALWAKGRISHLADDCPALSDGLEPALAAQLEQERRQPQRPITHQTTQT